MNETSADPMPAQHGVPILWRILVSLVAAIIALVLLGEHSVLATLLGAFSHNLGIILEHSFEHAGQHLQQHKPWSRTAVIVFGLGAAATAALIAVPVGYFLNH